ncbi:uncharacterized protein LOC113337208 [Papaver somniferum]|uniref:uncharacterized protein LOC113337208 n=1 Tax=Papaver somniferum TaxID=3469 RepID=UPI000E6FBA15|nr:uncharacterized protein LOC113337208 [Papaver somniferum]
MDNDMLLFVQGDIQLQGLIALVILIKNEDFYLNVDVIRNHTSRSNCGCSSSSGSSTADSCVTDSPKMVRVVDHDAYQAKPLICNEWIFVFDKIGREFMGGVKAVRIAVDKYKMASGHKIIILKNDKTRFTAKCAENHCGWRIHFRPVNGDISRFVLKDSNVIHRCRGTLMVATYVNGDNGFNPFAFGLVSSENKDNWFWFLENIKQVVDGRQIVFLSGRHEGLLQGIPRVFPDSYHSYCFYHIKCNLPIGSGDTNSKVVSDLFYKAAYSYTTSNFKEALRGMHAIGCGHVANYIRNIPKQKWENVFFPICKYSAHSSTFSESFNNWIPDFKNLQVFALLDAIRLKVMKMNSTRRVEGLETFKTRLTPTFEALLKENIDIGRTWTVTESMERLYEVASPPTHSVDPLQKTCTCHRWRVNGFPCAHACSAIQATREDIFSFVEPYFTTEWIIVPIPVPPPGRQKAQRFKNAWEKQKRPMMCTKFFTHGHHNRATFPVL